MCRTVLLSASLFVCFLPLAVKLPQEMNFVAVSIVQKFLLFILIGEAPGKRLSASIDF